VAKDKLILAQCEGLVMAKLEIPFGVEIGLVEPSPQAHPYEGLYIARNLIRDRREVPMSILNVIRREKKLTK
jgi:hypothetical protein